MRANILIPDETRAIYGDPYVDYDAFGEMLTDAGVKDRPGDEAKPDYNFIASKIVGKHKLGRRTLGFIDDKTLEMFISLSNIQESCAEPNYNEFKSLVGTILHETQHYADLRNGFEEDTRKRTIVGSFALGGIAVATVAQVTALEGLQNHLNLMSASPIYASATIGGGALLGAITATIGNELHYFGIDKMEKRARAFESPSNIQKYSNAIIFPRFPAANLPRGFGRKYIYYKQRKST